MLKLFGANLAGDARIYPSAKIWAPWNLEMGAGSMIGDSVDCYSVSPIILEADTTVSQYVFLCTASHDIESPGRELTHHSIRLHRGSWIFSGAFVGPGVTIGEGAVVAACSVVVKDVKAYEVVGGNPAKFIKMREFNWDLKSINSH